ncbi:MAG TPA: FliM/FliN family flagellar motor switch protein [Beijerinckiaceae bacterium]|nr:FliM/FliN family flagellar motor switch protein [Beijerinckiaceae bacterium]
MARLDKVEIDVSAVVGSCVLTLGTLLRLGRGARLFLDGGADAVDILANGLPIGQGRLIRGREERLAVEVNAIFERPAVVPEPGQPQAT